MDPITLGIAIALMRSLPGTASAQAAAVLEQAETVADSIPSSYTALVDRVAVLEGLGFYVDEDGYICQN